MLEHSATVSNGIEQSTIVSMRFPVMGKELAADHGFALYGAISRILPALHKAEWLAIELISGVPWREGIIMLPARGGVLALRLPADHCAQVLPLAGKRLEICGAQIRLGIPTMQLLAPAEQLYARMVIIKGFTEPEGFLEAAKRKLDEQNIKARLEIPLDEQGRFRRRVLNVHNRALVGFSLVAHDLNESDSLRLQVSGLGGKRHMGCGIFNPIKRPFNQDEEQQ